VKEPRTPRAPTAYRLDDPSVEPDEVILDALEPEEADAHRALETIVHPARRGIRWGAVATATGAALISLGIGLAIDALIRDLFARADWLGVFGLALLALFLLAILVLVSREVFGLFRLKRLARIRLGADSAVATNDRQGAEATARALVGLYSGRPETARGRRQLAGHLAEIMDGADLLALAERDLVAPLDAEARQLISSAARRVSVVTAVSPRAFVDVLYVLWECLRLIRRVSALYGGRPGTLGLLRLTRAVLGHLAVTGTLAVGDTILQQILGHGVAGRISARLGEGVVNGLMTARIGLSAMDVCRPLPFIRNERPRLKDLTGGLLALGGTDADKGASRG
jgi:putative membrane protein